MPNRKKKYVRKYVFYNKVNPYIVKLLRTDTRGRGIRTEIYTSKKKDTKSYIEFRKQIGADIISVIANIRLPNDESITKEFTAQPIDSDIQQAYLKARTFIITTNNKI